MYGVFACLSLYAPCAYRLTWRLERELGSLEMEIQANVRLEIKPGSSKRVARVLNNWAISLAPDLGSYIPKYEKHEKFSKACLSGPMV